MKRHRSNATTALGPTSGHTPESKTRTFDKLGMRLIKEQHSHGRQIVLVGDIVSGFEAYGPFESGMDAVRWKQNKGVREFTQGQWFLLPLLKPESKI